MLAQYAPIHDDPRTHTTQRRDTVAENDPSDYQAAVLEAGISSRCRRMESQYGVFFGRAQPSLVPGR